MITNKQIQEEAELAYNWKKCQLEFVKNNLSKDKCCNNCEHLDGCTLELLSDNIHPDKYICENFNQEKLWRRRWRW